MGDFFTLALLTAVLRMTTPLLFTALGGLISERSGVMNIGLEGLMLTGAFFAVAGSYWTGNAWAGLVIGVFAAAVGALIHAIWSITFRGDQIVVQPVALGLLAADVERDRLPTELERADGAQIGGARQAHA